MKSKYLIFDFDGTIVESLPVTFNIINRLAKEMGFKQVKKEEAEIFRNQGSREVIKNLGVSFYKLPKLVTEIRKGLEAEVENTPIVKGLDKVLARLKAKGVKLGILTSNSQESIDKFLKTHGWDYFDFTYSGSSLFGKGKVLRKLMKEKGLDKTQIIYVGDETRDIEAAKECGIKIAAVTWGYGSQAPLAKAQPDWLLDNPEKLLSI